MRFLSNYFDLLFFKQDGMAIFHTRRYGNIPTGPPPCLMGTSNARVCGKNLDFRPIFRFISKIIHNRAIQCQTDSKSYVIYRMATFSNDPNPDFKPIFQGHSLFDAEYLRNGRTRYIHSYNGILIRSLHTSYKVSFRMILSNLEKA